MVNNILRYFPVVAFSILFLLASSRPAAGMHHKPAPTNCDLHSGACVQSVNNKEILLDAAPKPVTAMQDTTFTVKLPAEMPALKEAPYILLDMPGMKMGLNRVDLQATAPGEYKGKGVIVRCRSGIRVWRATVIVPDWGRAEFIFDVVY